MALETVPVDWRQTDVRQFDFSRGMTMPKITFIGAGSTVFAKNILGDVMCTAALQHAEIALYDIDKTLCLPFVPSVDIL